MQNTSRDIGQKTGEVLMGQHGLVIWFTGLPDSGKTTFAVALEKKLKEIGLICLLLDGNIIRQTINRDLGFSMKDRMENIRRVAEFSKILINNDIVTLCAFVSPTRKIRNLARTIIGSTDFFEVYVNTSLAICEKRDSKLLYKKARLGEINHFTGITSVFEVPEKPDLVLNAENIPICECIDEIIRVILPKILRTETQLV